MASSPQSARWLKTKAFPNLSARVREAIERRHQPIARTLFSDFGIKVMRTDSDMMMGVTTDIAAAGIRSIPIHDSTIVQAKFATEAKAAMEKNLVQVRRKRKCL